MNNDNKSKDEGMRCQLCGHLSVTLEDYAEHKQSHRVDADDLATDESDQKGAA